MMFRFHRFLFLVLVSVTTWHFVSPTNADALKVDQSGPGHDVVVHVAPRHSAAVLVELVEAASGKCVQTLYAGRPNKTQDITFGKEVGVTGAYKVRYREGLSLAVKGDVLPGWKKPRWNNPTHFVIAGDSIYVMDAMMPWPNGKQNIDASLPPGANVNRILKIHVDGTLDKSFGKDGTLLLPADHYVPLTSFAVDDAGCVYVSSTYHNVMVFDAGGKRVTRSIGGWNNAPYGPVCTGWVHPMLLGADHRIYLPTAYNNMKVYDTTKNNFDGAISFLNTRGGYGFGHCLTHDEKNFLYVIGGDNAIYKLVDKGKELAVVHETPHADSVVNLTGPWATAGLVLAASRGPSAGPYWDSGGGGEVLLFWDDGQQCRLVQRFGGLGSAADRAEFMDPCCVWMSPDHNEVWVMEDGTPYLEGPSGNARLRRFEVRAEQSEEVKLELKW